MPRLRGAGRAPVGAFRGSPYVRLAAGAGQLGVAGEQRFWRISAGPRAYIAGIVCPKDTGARTYNRRKRALANLAMETMRCLRRRQGVGLTVITSNLTSCTASLAGSAGEP